MRRYNKLKVAVLGSALALATGSTLADPTASMLANTCAGCHGTGGASAGPATPNLAGYSTGYFVDTMLRFKNGERPATVMDRIAKGYSEGQIEKMAEYFAGKPIHTAEQDLDSQAVKMGEKLYPDNCSKCHDEGGRLPDDDAGILAGQWLPYMKYTMVDFKADNAYEMPRKMKKAVEELSEQELDAILQYFASQE